MNSRKYWERRAAQDMYDRMGTAESTAAEMNAAIQQTSAYLEKEVRAVLRGIQSFGISEAEAKKILNAAGDGTALQRLRKSAQQVSDPEKREALLNAINSAGAYRYRITRIEELNKDIVKQCRELYKTENRHITSELRNVAEDSYYREIFSIQKGTGLGFSFSKFSQKDVDRILRSSWSGGNYSQRIWKDLNGMTARLKSELLVSMLSGRSNEKTARIFQEQFGVNAFCARRIVRTESAYVANAAQSKAYDEAGIDRYRFVATLDSRTCECCAALDGKVFELAKAKPGTNYPPMHPFCRSTTIADFGDEELAGLERRAKDKDGNTVRVPAGMTYEDWHRKFVEGEPSRIYGSVKPDTDSARRKDMAAEMNKSQATVAPQVVSAVSSFTPAKTVQEAQEYAQKLGVKYADYSKFNAERANNINMAISTLPDGAVPVLVTDLQKYTKVTGAPLGRAQNTAYAVTVAPYEINPSAVNINAPSIEGSGEAIVAVNTRSFKSIDSLTKAKQELNEKYVQRYGHGWHFNTDGAATDFHECGHVYQNKYGLPTAFGADAARWQRETGLGILKSTNEAWAEAYGAYYTDRESLPDYIRRYFDPGEWKESSGSKVLSFDEWQKKLGKSLDKSAGSGIIEIERAMAAKSFDKAAEYARKELKTSISSLSELPLKTVNAVNNSIGKLYKDVPSLVGAIDEIVVDDIDEIAKSSLRWVNGSPQIRLKLSRSYFADMSVDELESAVSKLADAGVFTSKKGINGIIQHEAVHLAEFKQTIKRYGSSQAAVEQSLDSFEIAKELKELALRNCSLDDTSATLNRMLCSYAAVNPAEFLAEGYSSTTSNPLTDEIKRLLKKKWGM